MTDDIAGPRTQEFRRAEAERRLIAAAAEMVGEVGPSNVTLANVGERAGYSRGLATHHFGSKGALMQRLVEAVTHQFRDAMLNIPDRLAAMLAAETDAAKCYEILATEIRKALNEFSDSPVSE